MTEQQAVAIEAAKLALQRLTWLASETMGGNAFSRDDLWRWVSEGEAAYRKLSQLDTRSE